MINAPLSVYYATKFESAMWSSLHEQNDAASWWPEWINKEDRIGFSSFPDVEPDNMDANSYRRYCRDHHLPIGTEVKSISKLKYNTAVLLTSLIEPSKHLVAIIESLVRLPFSLGIAALSFSSTTVGLNRLCPTRIKVILSTIEEQIQSPLKNLDYVIREFALTVLYSLAAPFICYQHWSTDNTRGLSRDFFEKLGRMDGSYSSISDIYREMDLR
jgi:hypothetical protein